MAINMSIRHSTEFVGAKMAIICDDLLVTYLRDDFDHIPDPNQWDFPGGECEPDETAIDCVLRETHEEFGISLTPDQVIYDSRYPSHQPGRADVAFFVAHVGQDVISEIRFGDEGQYWKMMPVGEFLEHDQAVIELRRALRTYFASQSKSA